MALTCPNCGSEIPESEWGVEEAVEDDITDELVAHIFDPEDSIAVSETAYYCDPECFVEDHA
jgi:hypothetical protein